jgi:ornithine--oxo-acid transaminase
MRIASNYASLPVHIVKGRDIRLWDRDGTSYVDLLAGYSAVNQGHCHPRIVRSFIKQAGILTLPSRVVQTDKLMTWSTYLTDLFGYDKVLAMNSGAEAVETALKLARRYGRDIASIQRPYIACLTGNFHGRTLGTISVSDYDSYKAGFGPLIGDRVMIQMNDVKHLQTTFQTHGSSIAAILYEPIQGEGGVVSMTPSFADALKHIKKQHPHVLLMADEIQSGLGRTGYLTAGELYGLRPDVLILGKALSGGMIPMSCILANQTPMSVFTPGSHGSTFGGNPLACAVSMTAMDVIQQECLPNVRGVQHYLKTAFDALKTENACKEHVKEIRGHGLFWGVQFKPHYSIEALRMRMLEKGYITCTSRGNTLRITPPLTITPYEMDKAIRVLGTCL